MSALVFDCDGVLADTERDVRRTGRAAIVVDDLPSAEPWVPRRIEVRGGRRRSARPAT